MKSYFITSLLLLVCAIVHQQAQSQCSLTIPPQGSCSGCTNNPTGSITLSTNNSSVCYSGASTISTLTISGNNITVYICGNISITDITGGGTGSQIIINPGSTLTLTNQPGNFWAAPTYVNYGTFNISSSWSNFYGGKLITSGGSSVTNLNTDLTMNGATLYMNGGVMNISGTITLNSGSNVCLNSSAILKTSNIVNNANSIISVGTGNSACVYYTGNANISTAYLSSSTLNVCQGSSATGTSSGSSNWGPHIIMTTGCVTGTCAILLPVNFGSFMVNGNSSKVVLEWSTYSEQNSKYFEIQRSLNGVDFSTIGTAAAAGNSGSVEDYSFIDYSPLNGNAYYRIKLIVTDGNASYSEIQEIDIAPPAEMKVMVNNTQNLIHVILPDNTSSSVLKLIDMQGRVLKTIHCNGQELSANINVSNIFQGIYVVEMISAQTHQSKEVYIPASK
ncbi:MAG TPA: T9SS type A sorting domain-containing protein [Puia sp.]|nr:T9SS type A sorting domain-containing protein [Puia sp.]